MVELKVGQVWRRAGGDLVVITEEFENGLFSADDGFLYWQDLKDDERYYTFSWRSREVTDLMFLEAEAE